MEFLKNKQQVLKERLGLVNEATTKSGDTYFVKSTISVPKSLINQFVSKAKKENNIDAKENWSEVELAEEFIKYLVDTYLNVESLPVRNILKLDDTNQQNTEMNTQIEQPIQQNTNQQVQQPITQNIEDNTGVDASIQFENKINKNNEEILTVITYNNKKVKYTRQDLQDMLNNYKDYQNSDNLPKWLKNSILASTDEQVKTLLNKIINSGRKDHLINVDSSINPSLHFSK